MKAILEVKNLKKYFNVKSGSLHAVDDVSFSIEQGKTLGVVGESGCGKSTLGRVIMHLLEPTDGEIFFEGENVTNPSKSKLLELRKEMQMIFQDPYSSIDPRMTASQIIGEPLRIHKVYRDKNEYKRRVFEIMETVGLSKQLELTYPHELDGGRRQRIGIGRALALNPKFIICDEPVSALDVSIQAQIINLLQDLQKTLNLTYIFITHDLSVVKHISDEIAVLYLGVLVEKASSEELFMHQYHPYTKALISAIPQIDIDNRKERIILKGELASPIEPPPVCRFAPRCIYVTEECMKKQPELQEVAPGHFVACCRAKEINNIK
jgi:oligopeptide/dipeptide ABC transporter ATP-binding protein